MLGKKYPDMVKSIADLATIYHAQGRNDKAESFKKKALELRRETLREKYLDTIKGLVDLAVTYHM